MKTAYIYRGQSTDQGTFSLLACPEANFSCNVLELPWKQNQRHVSCIPKGEYIVKPVNSPKFNLVFWVQDVENRTGILIHSGNYAGDTTKGWRTHSSGCLLPGARVVKMNGQNAVTLSKNTVTQFHKAMNMEPFKLIIL